MSAANNYYGASVGHGTPSAAPNQYSNLSPGSAVSYGLMSTQQGFPVRTSRTSNYPEVEGVTGYGPYASRLQGVSVGQSYDDKAYYVSQQLTSTDSYESSGQGYQAADTRQQGTMTDSANRKYQSGHFPSQPGSVGGGGEHHTGSGSKSPYAGNSPYTKMMMSGSGGVSGGVGTSGWQSGEGGHSPYSSRVNSDAPSSSYAGGSAGGGFGASSSLYQQRNVVSGGQSSSGGYGMMGGGYQQKRLYNPGGPGGATRPRLPAKTSQLHYCEVCKISCAGAQTYSEHLEGKTHKKKETAAKTAASVGGSTAAAETTRKGASSVRVLNCMLCDVACTGADTYAAHIRGTKHQKVLSLHKKLGKPIPELPPVPVHADTANGETKTIQFTATKPTGGTPGVATAGGEGRVDAHGGGTSAGNNSENVEDADGDAQPVGLEYIEETRNESGSAASFYCKLCSCNFTDPLAKVMHSKGRRHRLAYKTKVDPSLIVDVKMNLHQRRQQQRGAAQGEARQRRHLEDSYRCQVEELRYQKEMLQWQLRNAIDYRQEAMSAGTTGFNSGDVGLYGIGVYGMGAGYGHHVSLSAGEGHFLREGVQEGGGSATTIDDRQVLAKHACIYPTEQDLTAVQTTVSDCEKALKLISDEFAQLFAASNAVTGSEKVEGAGGASTPVLDSATAPPRALKGVMRTGLLAKGLLLHNDLNMELVVLCSEKPTRTLLCQILDSLPTQLASISTDKYLVRVAPDGSSITVMRDVEPRTTCVITLTSHATNDGAVSSADALNEEEILKSLARLRHTKWFQAKASGLSSCVIIIRIMRDFCERVSTWKPLSQWALELLVEHAIASGADTTPAAAIRRVFECVASGILLPDGCGLRDPCEKIATDALGHMTEQQREDITNSAQHALRMITFGQLHRVLGMERLSSTGPGTGSQRKRPHADPAASASAALDKTEV